MLKIILASTIVLASLSQAHAGGRCFIQKSVHKPVCTSTYCQPRVKQQIVQLEPKVVEVKQQIDQKIVNKTDVINNLIMPNRLEALVIAPPPPATLPLTMRPFEFQPNMGPLPQRTDDYQHPFVAAVRSEAAAALILNNVVTRNTTTTISSSSGSVTTQTKSTAVQIDPKTGKATEITPEKKEETPEEKSEKKAAPPPPSATKYGY